MARLIGSSDREGAGEPDRRRPPNFATTRHGDVGLKGHPRFIATPDGHVSSKKIFRPQRRDGPGGTGDVAPCMERRVSSLSCFDAEAAAGCGGSSHGDAVRRRRPPKAVAKTAHRTLFAFPLPALNRLIGTRSAISHQREEIGPYAHVLRGCGGRCVVDPFARVRVRRPAQLPVFAVVAVTAPVRGSRCDEPKLSYRTRDPKWPRRRKGDADLASRLPATAAEQL